MKRLLYICIPLSILISDLSFAQTTLLTFDFSGNSGNETSVASNYNATDFSTSIITRGDGIDACGNGDRFCATDVNAGTLAQAITQNEYFEFTVQQALANCTVNLHSIIINLQRSGTGAKEIVLRSSADNYSNNIGNIGSINQSGTTTLTFPSTLLLSATTTTFRFYIYSAGGTGGTVGFEGGNGTMTNPDILVLGNINCDTDTPIPSLEIGALSTSTVNTDCASTVNNIISFDYTSETVFQASNSFIVELSTPLGTFPGTTLSTTYSFSSTGTLEIEIPSILPTGTYTLRLKTLSPAVTSNLQTLNIVQIGNCTPILPHLTSILYDGCDGPCGSGVEGLSEILFGNSGTYSFVANTANVNLQYTTGGYNLMTTVVSNPSKITALNTAAGCDNLFIDANAQTIPPNTSFLLVSENICIEALDWSSLCGANPIYVIFGNESASTGWRRGGNFGNSGNPKNFYLRITNTENTSTVYYTYTPIATSDGNYATYNIDNVASSTSSNPISPSTSGNFPNCSLSLVALDQPLIYFYALEEDDKTFVKWKIREHKNSSSHYILSLFDENLNDFQYIAKIDAMGEDGIFSHIHESTKKQPGKMLFKLSAIHHNGEERLVTYTLLNESNDEMLQIGNRIYPPEDHQIEVYAVDGRKIASTNHNDFLELHCKGAVIVHDLTSQKSYRFYIKGN